MAITGPEVARKLTPSSRATICASVVLPRPGRADEQHVVERFLARARRLDEHAQIGARLFLADEFAQALRPQGRIRVVVAAFGGDQAARGVHLASSLKPCRISVAVSAASPALRDAAAIAAAACGWP